eukprot:GFUD01039100.1.p1 GENE.GFUD01039100.1~~GFUD01039100.1.p1  ORF type:complete len:319 (-),score=59.52 GFUD01039100.1:422-1378(-)
MSDAKSDRVDQVNNVGEKCDEIQVKPADKLSFALGILSLIVGEYLALRHPHLFPKLYTLVITLLIAKRYPEFAAEKCQLFMLDFCYFMNLSTVIQINFYPTSLLWFKANYVLCTGSLLVAMVVWQNSLVLHSMEKMTSLFLHALAPLTLHLLRWGVIPCEAIQSDDFLSPVELLITPFLMYSVWQVVYLVIIELVLAGKIRKDPELVFSLRYLATDKNNGMHQLVTSIMRTLGVMGREEVFNPETAKTKIIFIVAQLVYTLITLLPVPLLYSSYEFSVVYISAIFGWTVWRGGMHYYEDFRERYQVEFQMKKVLGKKE